MSTIKHAGKINFKETYRAKVNDSYEIIANRYFSEDDLDEFFKSDNLLPRQDGVILLDSNDPAQKSWYEE